MSDETPSPPAAAAAASKQDEEESDNKAAQQLHGSDIAKVLSSSGPVVKCVLLRHMRKNAKDVKPHPASPQVDAKHKREILTECIDEILVDTTPSKNAIRDILGPFTFIGQFPTEGVVAMARKEIPQDLKSLSISQLRALCEDADVDTTGMLEKMDLVQALDECQLPVNPHKLQPPLDELVVRGDILLLKVAETEEVLDDPNGQGEEKDMKVLSNEEFFLNYTKEEYIQFASRTDVVAPEVEEDDDDDEENDDDDDDDDQKPAAEGEEEEDEEEDDEFNPAADGDPDEEEKHAMLNLIMAEVLRKFREEKGRGPNSEELLEIRRQVAAPLGIEVTTASDIASKRPAAEQEERHSPKRVKFTGSEEKTGDDDEARQDAKPAATPTSSNQDAGNGNDDDDKKEDTTSNNAEL